LERNNFLNKLKLKELLKDSSFCVLSKIYRFAGAFLIYVLNFIYKYSALPELENVFVKSQRDGIFIETELRFKKEPQRGEIYCAARAFLICVLNFIYNYFPATELENVSAKIPAG
jgi:hypothetical protein